MLPERPLRDGFLNQLDAHLRGELALPPGARLCVAYSGGTDSTALLAAVAALAPIRGYGVRAIHVHHGLQPEADAWEGVCRRNCTALEVSLQRLRWTEGVGPGESEEAAARRGRYELLASALVPGEWLLTAHQADDQAETLLLFLARGAGLDGLAGIEPKRSFGEGHLARPLLPFRRTELAAFVARCGLETVTDPTNSDPRFARPRVRHSLLPCLTQAMGEGAVASAARSAGLLQDARQVVEDVVTDRLAEMESVPGMLSAAHLAAEPPARGRLVLREALRRRGLPRPDRASLERARALAEGSAEGSVAWPGARVRRSGDRLLLTPEEGKLPGPTPWPDPGVPLEWGDWRLAAVRQATAEPPWPPAGEGHLLDAGAAAGLWVRVRRPGDRFRPAGGGPERSVGEALRAAGVPPHERDRVPLLVDADGVILAVLGVATAAPGAAQPGRPAWRVGWRRRD
jgi:tRNA(Ile)-lysidine synthase